MKKRDGSQASDFAESPIMMQRAWGVLLLASWLALPFGAWAQPISHLTIIDNSAPSSHVPVGKAGDGANLQSLEKRLREARGQAELRQLAEDIVRDPRKYGAEGLIQKLKKSG